MLTYAQAERRTAATAAALEKQRAAAAATVERQRAADAKAAAARQVKASYTSSLRPHTLVA